MRTSMNKTDGENVNLILAGIMRMNSHDLSAVSALLSQWPRRKNAVFAGKVKVNGVLKHVGEIDPKAAKLAAAPEKASKKKPVAAEAAPKKVKATVTPAAAVPTTKELKMMNKKQLSALADSLQISITAYLKAKGLSDADNEAKQAAVVNLLRKVFNFEIKNPAKMLAKLQNLAYENSIKISLGRGRSDETTKVYRALAQLIVAGVKPS